MKVKQELSTSELVERLELGDPVAQDELVRRYSRPLRMMLNRQTGGHQIVADLCQQTFRITLERIYEKGLRDPEKLGAFIFGIGRNLAIDYFRKNAAAGYVDIQEAEAVSDSTPNQYDLLLQKEIREIVRQVLDELESERDRIVLYRYYVLECDKQEICADLGLTSVQFNLILFRARQQYRKLFEKMVGKL